MGAVTEAKAMFSVSRLLLRGSSSQPKSAIVIPAVKTVISDQSSVISDFLLVNLFDDDDLAKCKLLTVDGESLAAEDWEI